MDLGRREFLKVVPGSVWLAAGASSGALSECSPDANLSERGQGHEDNKMAFEPTVDLHYHLDHPSPATIHTILTKRGLPPIGDNTPNAIRAQTQVTQEQFAAGIPWETWYAVHTAARKAIFGTPAVCEDVARCAAEEAEREGLDVRVLRFSSSIPEFCFMAKHQSDKGEPRKPDFKNQADKKDYLALLEQSIAALVSGVKSYTGNTKTPLVFSLSCQPQYRMILDDIAAVLNNFGGKITGLDLTNEQSDINLKIEYGHFIKTVRKRGIGVLTIHVGEKGPIDDKIEPEKTLYGVEHRIRAALSLEPNTLGHAIYAAANHEAMRAIAQSHATVELCPTSNLYLNEKFVEDVLHDNRRAYPLKTFMRAGIPCTLNTDVPGSLADVTLRSEFELVKKLLGLTPAELRILDNNASDVARKVYRIQLPRS